MATKTGNALIRQDDSRTKWRTPAHTGRRRSSAEARYSASASLMEAAVAQLYDVSLDELRASTRRKARVAFARQVAMYLSHVVYGMSLAAVGRHFGRDRTTAAHACRRIEDRRDDRDFDLLLERVERAVRALPLSGGAQSRDPERRSCRVGS